MNTNLNLSAIMATMGTKSQIINTNVTNILSLPDEILTLIFNQLGLSALASMSTVAHKYFKIIKNEMNIIKTLENTCVIDKDIRTPYKIIIWAKKIIVKPGVTLMAKEIETNTEELDCQGTMRYAIKRNHSEKKISSYIRTSSALPSHTLMQG